jgi:hypothetical protein
MWRPCLLLALAAVAVFAGCGGSKPGDVIPSSDDVVGTSATVQLPSGTLDVTVSKPLDEVDKDAVGGQPTDVDGGRYVGISWDFDQRSGGSAAVVLPLAETVEPARIALVADGHRYPVADAYNVVLDGRGIQDVAARDRYVAVTGDPDELRLEVTYDGLTQQVEFPSGKVRATQATALADIPQTRDVQRCRALGEPDLHGLTEIPFDCRANATARLPYVVGLGWAKPGREWAVVDVAAGIGPGQAEWKRPGRRGSVRYVVFGRPKATFTVDGKPPARTILDRDQPDDFDYVLRLVAFDVPAGRPATLRVQQKIELAGSNLTDADLADAPRDADLVVDAELDI